MKERSVTLECDCGGITTIFGVPSARAQAQWQRWEENHEGCDPQSDIQDLEALESRRLDFEWIDWMSDDDD